jgi:(p)ppGpp synthase/HD superfamily hydrolase
MFYYICDMSKIDWILEQHKSTNHQYDTYLPYEFHLRMVSNVAQEFINFVPDRNDGETSFRGSVLIATWGHDLIEDTRVSYNDVKDHLGQEVADIVYAVTNEKGKNRKERGGVKYYEGIRQTPGAVFVKLCDRIANVQYSKMTKSRMFEMYRKENDDFLTKIGYTFNNSHQYSKMFDYLIDLFEN